MKNLMPFWLCGFLAVFLSFAARAVPGDEHWDNQFNWPGPNGDVTAIAPHNGQLYVSAPGVALTNLPIEMWDGLQWSTMAQVQGAAAGNVVFDMAFQGDALYVAGIFTNVGGVTANGLAKWDGTNWSSIPFNGAAVALAVDGNNLYVGGSFTNAAVGGVTATNIGYWDGSAWHAFGNGLGVDSGNSFGVNGIALKDGLVYAGGLFTNSGSLFMTNLAVWDGTNWSAVGGGANNDVFTLAFNGNNLITGGEFTQVGTVLANGIAQWDGTNWSALGSGVSGGNPFSYVGRLAVFNGSVYASGSFTSAGGVPAAGLAVWNGLSWSAFDSGLNGSVARVISTGTNLLVGGSFILTGSVVAYDLAAWDGANWSAFGAPGRMNGVSSPPGSIGGSGTNLLVGGSSFITAGQTNATRIARFDGSHFYPIGTGLNSNVVAVAAVGTNYYAAGSFTGDGAGYGPLAYHMAHWDGTHWSELSNTPFAQVNRLGANEKDLYIAGYFGITATNGEAWWLTRWDGTNFWNVLQFPPAVTFSSMNFDNIGFSALAVDGTNVYASGQLTLTECDSNFDNCTNCVYAVHFDGTYAWPMGTGLNTNATSIAVVGTNVYFAGPYVTNAGGVSVKQIARWDGSQWHDVAGGVVGSGFINALAAVGTNLYAGGTFTNIGGVAVARIAKWDGANWSALGSGIAMDSPITPRVLALYADGSDLYVAGLFHLAGNKPSYYLALWNDQKNFDVPQISPLSVVNGQFQMRLAGMTGLTNIIEATTNFSDWTPILTNHAGIYDFTDPASTGYHWRFYRAVLGQ